MDTELSFDLSGKGTQRVLKRRGIVVTISCPLEDCTMTARGSAKLPEPRRLPLARLNLKPVTETVPAAALRAGRSRS